MHPNGLVFPSRFCILALTAQFRLKEQEATGEDGGREAAGGGSEAAVAQQAAAGAPGAQPVHGRAHGAHDLEGAHDVHAERVARRRRAQWQHGACLPARRHPLSRQQRTHACKKALTMFAVGFLLCSATDGKDVYLTKGDNNNVDDRGLYAHGQSWLEREDIVGVARASVPYVGMLTILLNDYPMLKYVLVGGMGLLVFTQRE
ncbi:hypothetical protein FI667_g15434, partial [Globisporangium splendens]